MDIQTFEKLARDFNVIPLARTLAADTLTPVAIYLAARRAGVDPRIAEMDLASIARITQLLEGMPLGLELAATWIKTLSCQEIATRLKNLG